jgi:hypothetical protein
MGPARGMEEIIQGSGDDSYDPSSSGLNDDGTSSIYGGAKSKSLKNKSAMKSEITSDLGAAQTFVHVNESLH